MGVVFLLKKDLLFALTRLISISGQVTTRAAAVQPGQLQDLLVQRDGSMDYNWTITKLKTKERVGKIRPNKETC